MKITHGKNVNDIYDRTGSYAGKKGQTKKTHTNTQIWSFKGWDSTGWDSTDLNLELGV